MDQGTKNSGEGTNNLHRGTKNSGEGNPEIEGAGTELPRLLRDKS
jgi:hypothetical protein